MNVTPKTSTSDVIVDVPSYYNGYYNATEEIMNWINQQHETNIRKFRSLLYGKLLEMQPRRLSDNGPR